MAASAMSAIRFWLYTFALLMVWVIVITTATPAPAPAPAIATTHTTANKSGKRLGNLKPWDMNSLEEKLYEHNCKSLCGQCGLLGFYCGEECLCEYRTSKNGSKKRRTNNSDTECLTTMQRNANQQQLPFQVLIQGPSQNRFVRTAMEFDQNKTITDAGVADNLDKRATIVIYKPYKAHTNRLIRPAESQKKPAKQPARRRRSVSQMDWFSDLASTLVRPAPQRIGAEGSRSGSNSKGNRKRDTSRSYKQKRQRDQDSAADKTQSWFTDSANLLLRPAPLRRQSHSKPAESSQQETEEEDESSDSGASMGRAFKNTIRNIQGSEFGENLRSRLRDGADIIQDSLGSGNFELFPKNLRDRFSETLDGWRKSNSDPDSHGVTGATSAPRTAQPFLIPWFRPVRFLQRVQQAIGN